MARFGSLGTQYFDSAGDPLVNGKLYFYESGTTTDKTTYADVGLTIPNTQPVLLDADGRQPNIFFNGSARGILTDNDDVQIEVRDPIGDDSGSGGFDEWVSTLTYNIPDIVIGSDGLFYISITDGNVGNDPTSSPENWSEIRFTGVWNTNEVYAVGDVVQLSDGSLYKAVLAQSGNNPASDDGTNWQVAIASTIENDLLFSGTVSYIDQTTDESIDLSTGGSFDMTITTTTTFTFDNPPATAGKRFQFVLEMTNGGSQTVNWPASVDWPAGTVPTLTTAGVDILVFTTRDNGTTWRGILSMGDSK